jgi:hypothetical protein
MAGSHDVERDAHRHADGPAHTRGRPRVPHDHA